GDPHPVSLLVKQVGDQYRRVRNVMLRRAGEVLDFYVECAARDVVARGAAEQRVEHRVAVRSWQTAPDNGAPLVDQRIERAIPDDAQRETWRRAAGDLAHLVIGEAVAPSGRDGCLPPSSIATSRRTSRTTSAWFFKYISAALFRFRPTRIDRTSGMRMRNTSSSVTSSPMYIARAQPERPSRLCSASPLCGAFGGSRLSTRLPCTMSGGGTSRAIRCSSNSRASAGLAVWR